MCYTCLSNLKNWNKKMVEVTCIQEKLITYLQQSESTPHRSQRSKRTFSEAEREESAELIEPDNTLAENLRILQEETLSRAEETLEPSEPGESITIDADESFNIDVDVSVLYD